MVSRPSSQVNLTRQNSGALKANQLASEALKRMMAATPMNAPTNVFLPKSFSNNKMDLSNSSSQTSLTSLNKASLFFNLGTSGSRSSSNNSLFGNNKKTTTMKKKRNNSSGGLIQPLTPLVPLITNRVGGNNKSHPLQPLQPLVPLTSSVGGKNIPNKNTTTTFKSSALKSNNSNSNNNNNKSSLIMPMSSPASDALQKLMNATPLPAVNNFVAPPTTISPASDALDDYLATDNTRSKKTKCSMGASPGSSSSLKDLLVNNNTSQSNIHNSLSQSSLKRKSTGSLATSCTGTITPSSRCANKSFNGGLVGASDMEDLSTRSNNDTIVDCSGMLPPWATSSAQDDEPMSMDNDEEEEVCLAGSLPPWACVAGTDEDEVVEQTPAAADAAVMPPPSAVPVSPAAEPKKTSKKTGAYDMTDLFNATQVEDTTSKNKGAATLALGLEFPTIGAAFPDINDDDDDDEDTPPVQILPQESSSSSSRGRSRSYNSLGRSNNRSRSLSRSRLNGGAGGLVRSKTLKEINRILSNHAMPPPAPVVVVPANDDNVFDFHF